MKPDEFIAWLAPTAQEVCASHNLPASVVIAQGALETGWGKYIIGEYNLFGRKWDGVGPYVEKWTKEYYPDKDEAEADEDSIYLGDGWWKIVGRFKDYRDLNEAITDWCKLITEDPLYADCLNYRGDLAQFARSLAAVYATDPEYANKVLRIIKTYELVQYDCWETV